MIRTRVGYAGGTRPNPTYRSLGDHTEVVEVVFDPTRIPYAELLRVFWDSHDPTARAWSRQYRSVILYRSEAQRREAEASRDREAARLGRPVRTAVEPLASFTPAEDYHQKYYLRQDPGLLGELLAAYPRPGDLVRSTVAARLNGLLGGNGSEDLVRAEIDRYGLSRSSRERVLGLVRSARQR